MESQLYVLKFYCQLLDIFLADYLTYVCYFHVRDFIDKNYCYAQIGRLPEGLNPPSSNMLYLSGPYLALAVKTGIITGILSLTVRIVHYMCIL